jgi:xanthine dehydrogenase iron-sulfur cluster and FAD-binding subunit A
MRVVARDIILRLPATDEVRVREELAGNRYRCTSYRGIVRAILGVLAVRRAALKRAFLDHVPRGGCPPNDWRSTVGLW